PALLYASLGGAIFGALAGVLVGAVIGTIVVAHAGTLVGVILGALVGRPLAKLKWKSLDSFEGTIMGAGIAPLAVAWCRDQDNALAWVLHGAWLGACAGVFSARFTTLFGSSSHTPRWRRPTRPGLSPRSDVDSAR